MSSVSVCYAKPPKCLLLVYRFHLTQFQETPFLAPSTVHSLNSRKAIDTPPEVSFMLRQMATSSALPLFCAAA